MRAIFPGICLVAVASFCSPAQAADEVCDAAVIVAPPAAGGSAARSASTATATLIHADTAAAVAGREDLPVVQAPRTSPLPPQDPVVHAAPGPEPERFAGTPRVLASSTPHPSGDTCNKLAGS